MDRFKELLACWRNSTKEDRCTIVDDNTTWEGERWMETVPNGDSMTIAGTTVPLHTQFLTCKEHTMSALAG